VITARFAFDEVRDAPLAGAIASPSNAAATSAATTAATRNRVLDTLTIMALKVVLVRG
jgi:hypothetical protein